MVSPWLEKSLYLSRDEAQLDVAAWLAYTIAAAAMGFGKSRFALLKAQSLASEGRAPLILCEATVVYDHIINEALRWGIPIQLMRGNLKPKATPGIITVSMLQTAARRDLQGYDDVILDECDRNTAEGSVQIRKVIEQIPVWYGCSGTVTKLAKGFNAPLPGPDQLFKDLSFEYPTEAGIRHGILVPAVNLAALETFDRAACSINSVTGEIDVSIMDCSRNRLRVVSTGIGVALRHVPSPKVLVHCSNIKHAELLAVRLAVLCPVAVCHSGMTYDAQQTSLTAAREGKVTFLLGVGMLSRGFDWPACNLVVLAFCTKSESRFVQAAARGGRFAEGKSCYFLLDFGGNLEVFGSPDMSAAERLHNAQQAKTERD